MIYPQNFEQKTGFDKIRHLITEKCLSPLGEERVAEMGFSADFEVVSKRLEQTDEFIRILHGDTEFPACHFYETFCLWADASIGPCAGSYPQGTSKFLINLLHHPPQGFGTVKTVPYRALYN